MPRHLLLYNNVHRTCPGRPAYLNIKDMFQEEVYVSDDIDAAVGASSGRGSGHSHCWMCGNSGNMRRDIFWGL